MDGSFLRDTIGAQEVKLRKSLKDQLKEKVSFEKLKKGLNRQFSVGGGTDGPIDWVKLGEFSLDMFQRTPFGQYLMGQLDVGSTAKVRAPKESVAKQAAPTQQTQLTNLATASSEDNQRPDNAHEAQIAAIAAALRRHTKEGAVELYRFCVNPDSFGQTVENLFAISFLVKENQAEHSITQDGKQMVRSLANSAKEAKEAREKAPVRRACMLRIEYSDFNKWSAIIAEDGDDRMVPTR